MMRPRSTFGGMRRQARPDDAADEGADTDERDDEPVDVLAGEQDEHRCGDEVHDEREDVLVGVEPLQGLEAQGAEQPHQQDAWAAPREAAVVACCW